MRREPDQPVSEDANHPGPAGVLALTTGRERKTSASALKALASEKRLAILDYLGQGAYSVHEIAGALGLSFTSATQHILILEKAGLIHTSFQPSTRGLKKVCARAVNQVILSLSDRHA